MMANTSTTWRIQAAIARLCSASDDDRRKAREEVITVAYGRYQYLATLMLNDMGTLRRATESSDVYHNAWIALQKAFETITPQDERHLRRLVRQHIRWQLLALLRNPDVHAWKDFGDAASSSAAPGAQVPAADSADPAKIIEWTEFHTQVGHLPEREREVFERIYYEDMSQQEVADDLGCSMALVKLRWAEAQKSLAARL